MSFLIGCNGVLKKRKRLKFLFLKLSILARSYNGTFILIDINIDKMATGGAWGQKATWKFHHLLLTEEGGAPRKEDFPVYQILSFFIDLTCHP